jgi:hypothetical protein
MAYRIEWSPRSWIAGVAETLGAHVLVSLEADDLISTSSRLEKEIQAVSQPYSIQFCLYH